MKTSADNAQVSSQGGVSTLGKSWALFFDLTNSKIDV